MAASQIVLVFSRHTPARRAKQKRCLIIDGRHSLPGRFNQ